MRTPGLRTNLAILLLLLLLIASAAQAIPLPERLRALGLELFEAQHDEEEGGKGDAEPIPDALEGALCDDGEVDGFACRNVDLLAFLPLDEIGGGTGNDIWGWTDRRTGREFVLMGRSSGTAFVEVTDPGHPVYLGNLPTHTFATAWRDLKVYRNHAYVVADSAGAHGLQVFDLRRLRRIDAPPLEFTEDAHYDGFGSAHNLAINEETGFAYAVGTGTCGGGLHMIDLREPRRPASAGCFSEDGYTHDTQCVVYRGPDLRYRGSEICFNANEDTLTIVDVSDKENAIPLARAAYDGTGYTHQGWATDDHAFFLLDDELDERSFGHGTRTLVWDISDLENPRLTGEHLSVHGSIDHNQYVRGRYTYQANYRSGLRILELEDLPSGRLSEVAFFDTFPADDQPFFDGAWGVYPFFSSGIVAVSDINRGLFLLYPQLDATIFADGFESGDLSAWSRNQGPAIAAAEPGLGGSGYALEVAVDGTSKRSFIASVHPRRESRLDLEMRLSANRVDLGDGEIEIARLLDRKRTVATLRLEQEGRRFWVHLYARNGSSLELVGTTRVPAARAVPLRLEWRRASDKRADDGRVHFYRKGKLKAQHRHLANGRLAIGEVRIGLPAGSAGTEGSGSFRVDDYAASR